MAMLRFMILAVLATPALAADPETLKQYQILNQGFYEFDASAYRSFSCHVDVNTLDTSLADVQRAAAAHPGVLQVSDTLAGYTLTVDHSSGVSITDPTLDIQLLDEKKAADPAKLKMGISQIQHGFTAQLKGADQTLIGIFQDFLGKIPDLTSVTRDGDKWTVKYMENGLQATDTVDGAHVHGIASGPDVAMVSDSDFAPVSGKKLAPHTMDIKITQGPQTLTTHMTLTYQKLGALQVPYVIANEVSVETSGIGQTTGSVTVTLQACSIKG